MVSRQTSSETILPTHNSAEEHDVRYLVAPSYRLWWKRVPDGDDVLTFSAEGHQVRVVDEHPPGLILSRNFEREG